MLNDIQKEKIQRIADDPITLNSLRAIFYEQIEKLMPHIESGENNQALGEKYRSYEQAQNILQNVFLDIETYQTGKGKQVNFNKEI